MLLIMWLRFWLSVGVCGLWFYGFWFKPRFAVWDLLGFAFVVNGMCRLICVI